MGTTLTIDLQVGFANDDIRIKVNGRQVYHNPSVTTNLLLGFADSIRVSVENGPTLIQITVMSRNLSRTETVEAHRDVYLGVSIQEGGLRVQTSTNPFGYA